MSKYSSLLINRVAHWAQTTLLELTIIMNILILANIRYLNLIFAEILTRQHNKCIFKNGTVAIAVFFVAFFSAFCAWHRRSFAKYSSVHKDSHHDAKHQTRSVSADLKVSSITVSSIIPSCPAKTSPLLLLQKSPPPPPADFCPHLQQF